MNRAYQFIRGGLRGIILDILGDFSKPLPGVHILNGHRLENKEESLDVFRKQLKELSSFVEFINIEEAVKIISEKKNPDKPLVAFTFDDGFMDCYTHFAPVLEEFGVNAIFFVNPNFVEGDDNYILDFTSNVVMTKEKKPMRWNQLIDLQSRGHIIGAHTMDHYMIKTNNPKILEFQIVECKKKIEEHLNVPCDYFAFPYGRLEHACRTSIDVACENYKYVFSQSDYKHYYSFDGKVINRRHFEPFWPVNHVKYFLNCKKEY
jgi:peptidoglycan/xylan/chitin deacetylase (PgdA/CDA1 family)